MLLDINTKHQLLSSKSLVARTEQVYDGDWVDHVSAYSNEVDLNFKSGRLQNILGVSQFWKNNPFAKAFHFYVFGGNILIPGGAKQTAVGAFDQATYSVQTICALSAAGALPDGGRARRVGLCHQAADRLGIDCDRAGRWGAQGPRCWGTMLMASTGRLRWPPAFGPEFFLQIDLGRRRLDPAGSRGKEAQTLACAG